MCYEENRERPLGVNEAEAAWLDQMSKYRTAMNNDIYTNGGLLDNTTKFGYAQPQMYGSNQIARQILETEFTYEELSFISGCRLPSMTLPDIDRLMSLIKRFKQAFEAKGLTMGHGTVGYPNNFVPQYNTNVQPLYGAPAPMSIPPEWMGVTSSGISRRQMGTKDWDWDDVQKGPNEPDEQKEKEEEMPSFLGSVWDNKPSPVRGSLYNGLPGAPEPGFKNRTKTKRVVLSAEGVSSETEDETEKKQKEFTEMVYKSASDAPGVEPPGSKGISSLKAILDYPSTGVEINENPVPLTEENKSVDKDNEKD